MVSLQANIFYSLCFLILLLDVALVREDEEFFQSDDSNSEYLEVNSTFLL